jgi:hypothetical protein
MNIVLFKAEVGNDVIYFPTRAVCGVILNLKENTTCWNS